MELAAIAGFYGVGPLFQALKLVGLGDPLTAMDTIKDVLGVVPNSGPLVTAISGVQALLTPFIGPGGIAEIGVPGLGPAGTYDSVNGLDGSLDFVLAKLGISQAALQTILDGLELIGIGDGTIPAILNQRRAVLLALGLGGTNTSIALREMIKSVESNDPDWKNGVTGVVAILIRNPSRPGGGVLAMLTPMTELVGINLTTPDGVAEGHVSGHVPITGTPLYGNSYVSPDGNKILNISVLDITAAYDIWSDAPTSLNPIAWANSGMAALMPTYLLPDKENLAPAIGGALLQAAPGLVDALGVLLDPTGGQGGKAIPIVNKIPVLKDIPGFIGHNTYVTYDSGNLPLLEPFNVVPRLLDYAGIADISNPVTDSFENVLTQMVALGYQDVNLTGAGPNQTPVFKRGFDMAGHQAEIWKSPITNVQGLQVPEAMFDATIDGLNDNLLSPENQDLSILGTDLAPFVYQNALTLGAAHALRDALTQLKNTVNPLFDQGENALKPVAEALDALTAQVNGVIDTSRAQIKALNIDLGTPLFEANQALDQGLDGASGLSALSADGPAVLSADAPQAKLASNGSAITKDNGTAPSLKLADLTPQKDLLSNAKVGTNAKNIAKSLKEQSDKAGAEFKAGLSNVQQQGEKAVKKVGDAVQQAGQNVKTAVDQAGKDVKKAASPKADKPAA